MIAPTGIRLSFFLTVLALCAAVGIAIVTGKYHIDAVAFREILLSIFRPGEGNGVKQQMIVLWSVRAPRILMAAMAGAALSAAGVVFQGLFRNPLVSPGILGVTSGAGFGASLALLLFPVSIAAVEGSAFIGGLIAVGLACFIGKKGDNSVTTLVLAGVIVSALFTAGISYVKCKADPLGQLSAIVFWTMGSFNSVTWNDAAWSSLIILVGLIAIHGLRWGLNPMAMGDEDALSLGINVSARRAVFILIATMVVAAATASCGTIGWVGLVIPHMARMMVGADHNHLVPFSALLGALFLLCMDTLARNLPGGEIPVGILTAFIGAPCFGYLLIRTQKNAWREP